MMVSYADLEKLRYYLKQNKVQIVDTIFEENVVLILDMTQEKWAEMLSQRENLNFKILKCEILGDKFIRVM